MNRCEFSTNLTAFFFVVFIACSAGAQTLERDGPFPREGECNIEDEYFAGHKGRIQEDKNIGPGSLKGAPIPTPENLDDFVASREDALILGKALFWDMQVGSDNIQACATCHFSAGADARSYRSIAMGGKHRNDGFTSVSQVSRLSFPFNYPRNKEDRGFGLLKSSDDVVGSIGVIARDYDRSHEGTAFPGTRQVTQRNAPTVINAIFYHRAFWDGRAEAIFNGVNHMGVRDQSARVARLEKNKEVKLVKVRIPNAAIASLAVAPIVSDVEMAFKGRTVPEVGRKLLDLVPLAQQQIHPEDSVLGALADENKGAKGLTYRDLVKEAFRPEWWAAEAGSYRDEDGYTQIERNFGLFFGLAIREYFATLVSDDARIDQHFDRIAEGKPGILDGQELNGAELFDKVGCADCHNGPEFSGAVYRTVVAGFENPDVTPTFQHPEEVERMTTSDCGVRVYDQGFYNIGVRPFDEDLGIGADDEFGNPLSAAAILVAPNGKIENSELVNDSYPTLGDVGLSAPIETGEPLAITGAFKIPSLRNVELTAPYFHTGGYATLEQVVEFYNRGGDFHDYVSKEGITQRSMMDLGIGKLNLSSEEIDDIVAFLKTMTDQRVARRSTPFDHPELFIPYEDEDATGQDKKGMLHLPATGMNGDPGGTMFGFDKLVREK